MSNKNGSKGSSQRGYVPPKMPTVDFGNGYVPPQMPLPSPPKPTQIPKSPNSGSKPNK